MFCRKLRREWNNQFAREWQKGEYDKINSSALLAQTLTAHLAEIAKDKHLGVGFSYDPIPISSEQKEPSPEDRERFRRMASSTNFGFEKVERLNGNIGYMELDGFVTTELGAETAIAAMQFLANTDALIIDLRYNGGGVPGTAQLIISYFFSETPVHYHSIYWRARQSHRTVLDFALCTRQTLCGEACVYFDGQTHSLGSRKFRL